MRRAGWLLGLLCAAALLGACSDRSTKTVLAEAQVPDELKDVNLIAFHKQMDAQKETLCSVCHGSMLDRVSLDPQKPEFHFYKLNPTDGVLKGWRCTDCHKAVDLVGRSGASLHKQVDVAICADCHKKGGIAKELYVE